MESYALASPAADRSHSARAPLPGSDSAPAAVLIVDDDALMGELLVAHIQESGYDAIHLSNGFEAYHWLQTRTPLLIITDLEMPFMDGWELCEKIAADASAAEVLPPPVIVMTAQIRLHRQPTIGRYILPKPFDLQLLDDALAALLPPRLVLWRQRPARTRKFQASHE